ncbi:pancreatic lipase-related protein [Elysia marginata]|uniref:Pancreatic lipase-related protein n=1 Tax=Elysia marginata TaxID=1093978 RepID=A0AAV4IM53_9GAST|nr:pancreatic lipase-related protein [Elysia marginata]
MKEFLCDAVTLSILGVFLFNCISLVNAENATESSELCFPTSIGFKDEWPFHIDHGYLPDSQDIVNPVFELYGLGKDQPFTLDYRNLNTTPDSIPFDSESPTKFIIHGFGNSLNDSVWITDMRKALQENGDFNIVLVGWDTSFPSYVQAVCNSRVVARLTVSVIEMLQEKGLHLYDLHLIGHSLGAHVSSYVGRLMNSNIGRITGLDPAGPWFDTFGVGARLDPSDAKYVDVIHSNGDFLNFYGGFGLLKQCGHVDFYPNGGKKQPGCTDGVGGGSETLLGSFFSGTTEDVEEAVLSAIGCSHGRAYEIFIESIKLAGSCEFRAFPCSSYEDFLDGRCIDCGAEGCNRAGFHASPELQGGKQFLLTHSSSPLCSKSVRVTIIPSEIANKLIGTIVLLLKGTNGEDLLTLVYNTDIHMQPRTPWRVVKPLSKDIGDIESGVITYTRRGFFDRIKLRISGLSVDDMHNGKRYITKSRFRFKSRQPVRLDLLKL